MRKGIIPVMKKFSLPTIVIISVFLQFFTVSCQKEVSKIVEGARIVVNSSYSVLELDESQIHPLLNGNSFIGAAGIYDIGGGCALLHMMAGAYCFTWIDLSTGETKGIIQRGRGPNEMLDAGFSGSRINEAGDTEILIYSLSSQELACVNLTKCLSGGSDVIAYRRPLPKSTMYALSSSSDLFCYVFEDHQTVSWVISDESGEIEKVQPFGDNGHIVDASDYFAVNAVSEDGKYLLMGMASFPRLFIFNREGENISVAFDNKETDAQINDKLSQGVTASEEYCVWIQIKDKRIYYLTLDQDAVRSGRFEEILYVLDLKGKVSSALRIKEPLTSFIVSSNGETLTGITMNGELYSFSL